MNAMNTQQMRDFILAGNALFTLKSLRTQKHFTFKVVRAKRWVGGEEVDVSPPAWHVRALSGPDNTRNYRHVGTLFGSKGERFVYAATIFNSRSARGFDWCWKNLDRCGERFEFAHAGKCGRCGRLLTTPESVAAGIGPECRDRMDFDAAGGVEGLMKQLFGG